MGTTVVMLEIQIKPECVDEVKALLKEALPDTRAYAGCQGIDIYATSTSQPTGVFMNAGIRVTITKNNEAGGRRPAY